MRFQYRRLAAKGKLTVAKGTGDLVKRVSSPQRQMQKHKGAGVLLSFRGTPLMNKNNNNNNKNLAAIANPSSHFLGYWFLLQTLAQKRPPFPHDLSTAAANVAVTRNKMR